MAGKRPARSHEDNDLLDIIPERLTGDGDGAADEGRRGRSLLIAGLLIGVAVAGGAGWYLLGQERGTSGAVPAPVISGDPSPYKVRPADPGGMQVPNQDKLVYERINPADDTRPGVEKLLPEPQAPVPPAVQPVRPAAEAGGTDTAMSPPPPPPLDGDEPTGNTTQADTMQTGAAPASASAAAITAAPAAEEAQRVPARPEPQPAPPQKSEEPQTPAPAPTRTDAKSVEAKAAPEKANAEAGAVAAKASAAPAAAPQKPTPAQTAAAVGGPYTIQLAALRDEASARKTWETLKAKHADLLGGLAPRILRADLGSKGVFYRVRATGIGTEKEARNLCEQLANRKVGCLFVGK